MFCPDASTWLPVADPKDMDGVHMTTTILVRPSVWILGSISKPRTALELLWRGSGTGIR